MGHSQGYTEQQLVDHLLFRVRPVASFHVPPRAFDVSLFVPPRPLARREVVRVPLPRV